MRLKGEMVIELTDTNTGAVETVQETNMITEAVNNILGLNPMGIYLKASGEYDNSVLWNGTLLPICPNMIGGILLFPAAFYGGKIQFFWMEISTKTGGTVCIWKRYSIMVRRKTIRWKSAFFQMQKKKQLRFISWR